MIALSTRDRVRMTTLAVILGAVGFDALTPSIVAHGGALDANGCHNDRKNGGYHCHRSPAPAARPSTSTPQPAASPRPAAAPAATADSLIAAPPVEQSAPGALLVLLRATSLVPDGNDLVITLPSGTVMRVKATDLVQASALTSNAPPTPTQTAGVGAVTTASGPVPTATIRATGWGWELTNVNGQRWDSCAVSVAVGTPAFTSAQVGSLPAHGRTTITHSMFGGKVQLGTVVRDPVLLCSLNGKVVTGVVTSFATGF